MPEGIGQTATAPDPDAMQQGRPYVRGEVNDVQQAI